MPPRKPNPAAGKQTAETQTHYSGYTRKGRRVSGHTRSVKGRRMVAAGASATTSGVVAFFSIAEAGFTIVTAVSVVLVGAFTWLAVIAGDWAAENKKKQQAQRKRTSSTRRTGTRTTGTRSSTRKR